MKKTDFNVASSASLYIEALERGNEKLANELMREIESNDNLKVIVTSNLTLESKKQIIQNLIESSYSLTDIVAAKIGLPKQKNGITSFVEARKNKLGAISIRANSPLLNPQWNSKAITETSGATLVGTITRPDLTELPNVIPTLQKIGITFNYVNNESSKQAIPTVISNVAGADILNGTIVGSMVDPVFDFCPGNTYLYTLQLPMTRKFFAQKTPATDELFKQMIFVNEMEALLYRILYGETASGQCLGLYNNSDVSKIASDSFDESKGYALMDAVHTNEAPAENCLWVLNSATEKLLKSRVIGIGSDHRIIERGMFLDKPYVLSERITSGQVWYGAFQSVVLTLFNTEIIVDPFSGDEITIKIFQPYSSDIRHPGWIVCGTGVN